MDKGVSMQKLEPIIFDKEYSAFELLDFDTDFKTELTLQDYDWIDYCLCVGIPTKQYGRMSIEFEYNGINVSTMKVWIDKPEKRMYFFEFNSKIFQEHIVKFMQRHIASWNEKYSFEGLEEVINFYNAVLVDSDTIERQNKTINSVEYIGAPCDNENCSAYDGLTKQCNISGKCYLVKDIT